MLFVFEDMGKKDEPEAEEVTLTTSVTNGDVELISPDDAPIHDRKKDKKMKKKKKKKEKLKLPTPNIKYRIVFTRKTCGGFPTFVSMLHYLGTYEDRRKIL